MIPELLYSLMLFALVSSITPGPNNLMLMSSGVNFGIRASLPHMFGVAIGFTVMIAAVGLGALQLFKIWPATFDILRIICAIYLMYLAYKIASSSAPVKRSDSAHKPLTFLQAALFQWVNPKAWAMAVTATSVYAADSSLTSILAVSLVFGVINLPCISVWVGMGHHLAGFLNEQKRLRYFNILMAVLLVASVLPALIRGT
ncbi:LysE family translocator [Salinimonas sediminis]|uniref:LysE family translocator n=1 Tax=Salinimonas sediminis TaxID=2303538 RepID=A0A346NN79_9ALTE|nr:LysE family translocator [Salinimonas sediminis]AXR06986.1 LysE family translocator [Salinimonas sediminis]